MSGPAPTRYSSSSEPNGIHPVMQIANEVHRANHGLAETIAQIQQESDSHAEVRVIPARSKDSLSSVLSAARFVLQPGYTFRDFLLDTDSVDRFRGKSPGAAAARTGLRTVAGIVLSVPIEIAKLYAWEPVYSMVLDVFR